MRHYLLVREELPHRPLVAQVPVSTRGDNTEVGNQISSMTVGLATDVDRPGQENDGRSTPTRRARKRWPKRSRRIRSWDSRRRRRRGCLALAARAYTASHVGGNVAPINLVISNVPGVDFPLYLSGSYSSNTSFRSGRW